MVRNIKPTESKEETQMHSYNKQAETCRESPVICQQESRQGKEQSYTTGFGGAYPKGK
jgi:hypothetical protein